MFASSDGDRRARAVRGCLGVTTRRIRVASEGRPRVRGASRIADGVRRDGRRQGDGWNGPGCPLDDGSTTCPGFDHGRSRFFLTAGESRARENPQAVTAAAKALLISCQLYEVTLRPSNLTVTPADPWRSVVLSKIRPWSACEGSRCRRGHHAWLRRGRWWCVGCHVVVRFPGRLSLHLAPVHEYLNRPGMSGDSGLWGGWSHARQQEQALPGWVEDQGGVDVSRDPPRAMSGIGRGWSRSLNWSGS